MELKYRFFTSFTRITFRPILERDLLGNFGRLSILVGELKRQDGSTNSPTFPICLPRAAAEKGCTLPSIVYTEFHRGKPIVQ